MVHYLRSTEMEVGLVMNFGGDCDGNGGWSFTNGPEEWADEDGGWVEGRPAGIRGKEGSRRMNSWTGWGECPRFSVTTLCKA